MGDPAPDIHAILKRHWGFDSFRPLQEDIIRSVLEGHDTLGLMPTGGGKSIIFQVAGLCFPDGLTIVVTPLISLMKDQVDNLKRHHIKAATLHSGMSAKELRMAWELITKGGARFLYVSPEKLQNDHFCIELMNLKVNLITIDEAHCISQWGYDFRPSYLNVKKLRQVKPDVPMLALTATAPPMVVDDIMKILGFRRPKFFKKSFHRPNLSYLVRQSDTKISDVLHILSRTSGSAIVYTRSRKRSKELAEYLESAGISASFYHAGLDRQLKVERQNSWRQGGVRVMVATNAFGMGIDKPDVRVVIHFDVPPSLEEYYQEAGRAGRDGLTAYAVLLVNKSDQGLLRRRVTEAFPPRPTVKTIYEQICIFLHLSIGEGFDSVKEFDIVKFCELFGHTEKECRAALRLLYQSGYLRLIEDEDKRSRMKILCDREELYDVKFSRKTTEDVLAMCLRLYTGLFTDYSYIRESEIALNLKINNTQVYEALLELDRMKIIDYIPRSGLPLIHVMTAREETSYLLIPKTVYEERKEIMAKRTESMIGYFHSSSSCRVNRMLKYFGEVSNSDCQKCDVCRDSGKNSSCNKKQVENEPWSLNNILNFIRLHPEGVRYQTITTNCGRQEEKIKQILSYLCNEGFVRYSSELYYPG